MKHAWMLAFLTAMCFAQDKTVDKKFWTVTAFSAASTAADADTTANFGPRCTYEETNPGLYGEFPTAKRVTIVMGGLFVASVGASYVLKRYYVHIWKVPLWPTPEMYLAYGHAVGAAHNARSCY